MVWFPACGASTGGEPISTDASAQSDGVATVADVTAPDATPPSPTGLPATRVTTSKDDELYPDLDPKDADALVYVVSRLDPAKLPKGTTVAPNCIQCPTCQGCAMEVWHKNVSSGKATKLTDAASGWLNSSPRISGGVPYWLRNSNELMEYDFSKQAPVVLTFTAPPTPQNPWTQQYYFNNVPELSDGVYYWYGWHQAHNKNGILRVKRGTTQVELVVEDNLYHWYFGNGGGSNLGRRQVFTVSDNRIAYPRYDHDTGVQRVRYMLYDLKTGQKTTLADADGYTVVGGILGGGRVAWKRADAKKGCSEQGCEIDLVAKELTGTELGVGSSAAKPSVYAELVMAGSWLLWVDYREVTYAVYGVDLASNERREVRVTGEEAVVGAYVGPVVSGNRIVWMDRRSGNWDLWRAEMK